MRRIESAWLPHLREKVLQGAPKRSIEACRRAFYAGAREVLDQIDALRTARGADAIDPATSPAAFDAERHTRLLAISNYLDTLGVDVAAFEQSDRGPV